MYKKMNEELDTTCRVPTNIFVRLSLHLKI
jgi:hypothetical protein